MRAVLANVRGGGAASVAPRADACVGRAQPEPLAAVADLMSALLTFFQAGYELLAEIVPEVDAMKVTRTRPQAQADRRRVAHAGGLQVVEEAAASASASATGPAGK
jgi:hypothetical protein